MKRASDSKASPTSSLNVVSSDSPRSAPQLPLIRYGAHRPLELGRASRVSWRLGAHPHEPALLHLEPAVARQLLQRPADRRGTAAEFGRNRAHRRQALSRRINAVRDPLLQRLANFARRQRRLQARLRLSWTHPRGASFSSPRPASATSAWTIQSTKARRARRIAQRSNREPLARGIPPAVRRRVVISFAGDCQPRRKERRDCAIPAIPSPPARARTRTARKSSTFSSISSHSRRIG